MTAISTDQRVNDFLAAQRQLFIGGQQQMSLCGKTFDTPNPATGARLATVAEGQAEDIDAAVAAARAAFDGPWSAMTPAQRAKILWKIGDLIEEHAETLAEIESLDNGKPKSQALVVDIAAAAEIFRYMAGWCTKLDGKTVQLSTPYAPGAVFHAYTVREPVGVVGQIIPWNFPLLMAAWKLAPALACGNTAVLKPAEQTPLSALYLADLIDEAGLPAGVVNVVTGFGDTAGAALAAHPGVDKIAFTGSTEVGKLIVDAARANLKKVTLELGGKAPNIVFADADVEAAIRGAAEAIFFNQGQVCCAGSRLFVENRVYDDVVAEVSEIAAAMKLGDGRAPDTTMGPLVSAEQRDRVSGYVDGGLAEGAVAVTGGAPAANQDGYFYRPTVLTGTRPDMAVVREEVFGPVLVVDRFDDPAQVVRSANDTVYGLSAGIWTKDVSKAHRMAKAMQAGTVWINCFNILDAALPFGGYKQSGWGREMGQEVLDAYTQTKSVVTLI
ncbi:aldehyde dehydrogenase family protein [Mycobacterium simiae]|uniref:Putative succinate-semialdehyde dehydrogenase [NADP(+)] 2 n=1 Tax=Mycobacterium simiae TaxID=1784 RepID=A0A5B1BT07_MYCSI|nr:aldehyde dehydrogenase family protein [Mycobacterium simiae]KAA1251486.1 aldehyde dehydrogenase family protein [Mycobacterium simiae]